VTWTFGSFSQSAMAARARDPALPSQWVRDGRNNVQGLH